jgi:hypothetical protein
MRRIAQSVGISLLLLAVATSQELRTFTHPTLGFAISAPASWKPDTSDPEVAVGFEAPEDSSFYLAITSTPLPMIFASESTYRNVADGYSSEYRSGVAEELGIDVSKVVEVGRRIHKVRGMQVATLDFRAPAPDDWVFRARTRLVIADGKLYAVTISADEDEFTENEPLVNQILDSFEPKDRTSGQFPVRLLGIALGVACLVGVLMLGGIVLLVRKLTGRL